MIWRPPDGLRPPTTCRTSRTSSSMTRPSLQAFRDLESSVSEVFLEENYRQMSCSEINEANITEIPGP